MAEVKRASWGEALRVYLEPRQLIILIMGFSSGLPLLLTGSTLSYWLTTVGVDYTTIGLFAAAGLPYTLKFTWSPIIDQVPLPLLGKLMGQRKSWLLVIQLLLAAAIFALGFTDPSVNPLATAFAVLVVAFFSSSQDIVIDAYRIELLAIGEQGAGAATTQVGYRIALLMAGAGALALSDFIAWQLIFAILAGAILLCAIFTLFIPEPDRPAKVQATTASNPTNYVDWINIAVVGPFSEFMRRPAWVVVLLFVLFYKFGDAFGGVMANPFYKALQFSGVEIATITKLYGILATVIGGIVGGAVVARIGIFKTLMIGGILQAATNLLLSLLAVKGHDIIYLGIAITADNLAGGIASAALVAYLSALCNRAFTATQYALLSSFMAQGRTLMSTPSGWLIDHLDKDWALFWALTALMAIPGLLLLFWISRIYPDERRMIPEAVAAK